MGASVYGVSMNTSSIKTVPGLPTVEATMMRKSALNGLKV